jgi:hypothetical protein
MNGKYDLPAGLLPRSALVVGVIGFWGLNGVSAASHQFWG